MDTTVTNQDSSATDTSQNITSVQNNPEMEQLERLAMLGRLIGKQSPTANNLGGKAQAFLDKQKSAIPAASAEAPTGQVATTPAPENTTTTEGTEPDSDEMEIEGGLKITLPNITPKTTAPTVYNTPEEAFEAMKKNFGIAAANPTEFVEKATKAFTGHRTAAQEAGELKKYKKDIGETFEKMPVDLLESFAAWQKGEDYKAPMINTGIDFNKPAEAQDKKALINKFFPGDFTEEDFTNHTETPNPAIVIAEKASLDKFNTLKGQRESAANAIRETQKQFKAAFDASAVASVSRITEELPYYTDKAAIPAIEADVMTLHTLRGTPLAKYFLNDDGTVQPGAAARLAMLKDGKGIVSKLIDRETQKAKSKATEEVITRGADSPSQTAGHNVSNGNQVPEEVQQVQRILSKKKSPY